MSDTTSAINAQIATQGAPQCTGWRSRLAVHPAAELLPMLDDNELLELTEDIKAHGLRTRVALYEQDNKTYVLDGRNRLCALELLGRPLFRQDKDDRPDENYFAYVPRLGWDIETFDPYAYVVSANLHRRHLTREQKRELIAKLLKAQPEKSNRQIAGMAKADHKTVGAMRATQEARGEIPHVEKRADTKGRKQPTKKSAVAPEAKAKRDAAEREAERDRLRAQELAAAQARIKAQKPKSRPSRWADAVARATEAVQELIDMQGEYREWHERLPENQQDGTMAEKLQAVIYIDLDGIINTLSEAESADLPLGFGRD